jgi:nucleotide-binding universal stress UspA family protein
MFMKVLVGIDVHAGGHDAVVLARQLAAPRAEITLAHVHVRGLPYGDAHRRRSAPAVRPGALLERERDVASLDAPVVAYGDRSVGRGLHRLAELERVDLLVVGSCRRGPLGRVLCGSDMLAALSGAPCAVAIAPIGYAARAGGLSAIGVGYDGSLESEQGLLVARELAGRHGSRVKVLAVSSLQAIPYGESIPLNWLNAEKRTLAEKLARLGGLRGVEGEVTYGEPKDELAAFAEELDLLIVGSRSYGPAGRLVNGSVSRYLAERARCPLLVLPRSARKEAEADAGAELVASPA